MKLEEMDRNPVVKTGKWLMGLLKNKIIVTLLMLVTGIVFIVAPSGNMNATVIIAAVILIVACLVNIGFHLLSKDRTKLDVFFSVINGILIVFAVFCLISPSTVEPFVRTIVAVMTILINVINLIEVFKLEDKKSWRFYVGLFVAVIMIGLGIGMIAAGETVIASMQQGIGIFLIINSVINLWYIIRLGIEARKAKKAAPNE